MVTLIASAGLYAKTSTCSGARRYRLAIDCGETARVLATCSNMFGSSKPMSNVRAVAPALLLLNE